MKRVLVVTRNFPPLWGGMERLNRHLVDELRLRFDVELIAPVGAKSYVSPEITTVEVPLKPLSWFLCRAGWQAVQHAVASRPDVVIGGSGLVAPIVLLAARLSRARAVVYVHGLDLTVPHPLYRRLWIPALRRLDAVVANSSPTKVLAREVGVDCSRISVVHPGVSVPKEIDLSAAMRFRNEHHLGEGPILLSVGRLTERKGLKEFVRDVLPKVAAVYPAVKLVVVGEKPTDSLYAEGQSVQSIQDTAKLVGVAGSIHFLGKRFGKELEAAYTAANLHVFPVRHIPHDPEGFGMVAVEAAAHGVPTVGYATGGVVDAIADQISGRLVSRDDSVGMATAIVELLGNPLPKEEIRQFAGKFEWSSFGDQVGEIICSLAHESRKSQPH